jgi:hypothetical protein
MRQSSPPDLLHKLCHVFLTSTQLMPRNKPVAHDPHTSHMQSDHTNQPSRPLTCKDKRRQRLSSAGSKEVQHRTQQEIDHATEFPPRLPHGLSCSLPIPVPSQPNCTAHGKLTPGSNVVINRSGFHLSQARTEVPTP